MLQKLASLLIAYGPLGIFLLAGIDSAGVPVPGGTDLAVLLLAIKAPRQAWWGAAMAIAGSVAGNLVLFQVAWRGGRRYAERAVVPGKRQRFRAWFNRYGLATVYIPALLPIPLPLKIFVISAGALHMRLRTFFIVILLARVPRYLGFAYLGRELGLESTAFLKNNAGKFGIAGVLLLVFLYALIRISEAVRRHEPAAPRL